ncbi:hypothetical protein BELL_1023g00020 [Botrytis elliptica]|uniref:Uncharacterized protein n=1 Tax=Botrytis elliptica TaxID=278938 RepID=A0A4Z1J7X3_9HELO|nr:hypothetical protein BELL_1023g00020 [Botrytis elliptica]
MGPLIQHTLSYFQRRKIPLEPILRMTIGFFFIAAGIGYAAGLQQLIYSRGPCYHYLLECAAARNPQHSAQNINVQANKVSVWLQTPLQFLLAIGEILCLVSLSEYTYNEAPTNLKALVQAFQAVAAALGAAIGIGLGPVSRNPWLVIMFACLAGTMAITAVFFWAIFRSHDVDYAKVDVVDDTDSNENGGQRVTLRLWLWRFLCKSLSTILKGFQVVHAAKFSSGFIEQNMKLDIVTLSTLVSNKEHIKFEAH